MQTLSSSSCTFRAIVQYPMKVPYGRNSRPEPLQFALDTWLTCPKDEEFTPERLEALEAEVKDPLHLVRLSPESFNLRGPIICVATVATARIRASSLARLIEKHLGIATTVAPRDMQPLLH